MVDKSKVESIIRMMDQDNDGEALNALRLLRRMAQKEGQNLAEFLFTAGGHRPQAQQQSNAGRRYSDGGQGFWEDVARRAREAEEQRQRDAARRRQEETEAAERRRRNQQESDRRNAERRQREREAWDKAQEGQRKARYGAAFDDAEMSDADRAKARAGNKKRRFGGPRDLLDQLEEIATSNDIYDFTMAEQEFITSLPFQYAMDALLSDRQVQWAEDLIRKWHRNKKESPI